jgi:type IV pilus assembly protein PilE
MNGPLHRAARHPAVRGFTLIELMVAVAILAIIAAVAYPSFSEQVARGKRSEARSLALESTQWMERFYSENYRYDKNTAGVAVAGLYGAAYTQVPASGTKTYELKLENVAAATYTLVAERSGAMASDRCGDYVITHTGAKGLRNFNTSDFADEAAALKACWK